jgi:hypothetical protein
LKNVASSVAEATIVNTFSASKLNELLTPTRLMASSVNDAALALSRIAFSVAVADDTRSRAASRTAAAVTVPNGSLTKASSVKLPSTTRASTASSENDLCGVSATIWWAEIELVKVAVVAPTAPATKSRPAAMATPPPLPDWAPWSSISPSKSSDALAQLALVASGPLLSLAQATKLRTSVLSTVVVRPVTDFEVVAVLLTFELDALTGLPNS